MFKKIYISLLSISMTLSISGVALAVAPSLSKDYKALSAITPGSIVGLVKNSKDTVIPANSSDTSSVIGVVEQPNNSLLSINPSSATVQVAFSGVAQVLVSTVNGPITEGQYVAVSPFGGMGMASNAGDTVIGIAEANFDTNSSHARQQSITDLSGKTHKLTVGEIPVSIAIGTDNRNLDNAKLNTLQKLARSITGHVISTGRVIAALCLTVIAFATLITLTYSATYSSIISIGRNPLAKGAIFRSLRSIAFSVTAIALVTGLLVYLLLR